MGITNGRAVTFGRIWGDQETVGEILGYRAAIEIAPSRANTVDAYQPGRNSV